MKNYIHTMDRDPWEDEKVKDAGWKFIIFLILCGMFCYGGWKVKAWIGIWSLFVTAVILMRIYLSGLRAGVMNWNRWLCREVVSAWRNGDITLYFLTVLLAAGDAVFLLISMMFRLDVRSFSEHYRNDKLAVYRSGRGKYYGMHLDTANDWSDASVSAAECDGYRLAKSICEMPVRVERKGELALAIGSIVAFLVAPFSVVRTQQKDEKKAYGYTIFNFKDFSFGAALAGLEGNNRNIRYLTEVDLAQQQILNRALVSYSLNRNCSVVVGRDFTPVLDLIPAPPDGPFAFPPLIMKEATVTADGITAVYDDSRGFYVKVMAAQHNKKMRAIGLASRTSGPVNLMLGFDKSDEWKRLMLQAVLKHDPFGLPVRLVGGIIASDSGCTSYAAAFVNPAQWLEFAATYQKSPWISTEKRWILGFSLLFEGIRLRTSWASDVHEWRSQLTYSF
jgi:hypothetical protein